MKKNQLVINYGSDITAITIEALEKSDMKSLIKPGQKIIIKPNLVNSTPASQGATTHPEIVTGIIEYLFEYGHKEIEICESSWVGGNTEQAYKICGYGEISKRYNVPLINVLKGKFIKMEYRGHTIDISQKVLEGNFLIDVPVLKAHCQTEITCCIKNLKGIITNQEKRSFHSKGLHGPIAALAALVNIDFNVVDGICGDLTFEEGGNPVQTNMVIAGEDPVLIDSYAAEFMGYEPNRIKYLSLARDYGVGQFYSPETKVIALNSGNKPRRQIQASHTAKRLAVYIDEKQACSACYSALIHALYKSGNKLDKYLSSPISIGQGFKGVKKDGLGVGNCTGGCGRHVKGCPPTALDIMEWL